jgi:hypothetical protein
MTALVVAAYEEDVKGLIKAVGGAAPELARAWCRVPRRNGVLDAAHALGGGPGMFGSASASVASTLRAVHT